MLYSVKTLDLPDKDEEEPLFSHSQGNIILASNLNRKSQLDQVQIRILKFFVDFPWENCGDTWRVHHFQGKIWSDP